MLVRKREFHGLVRTNRVEAKVARLEASNTANQWIRLVPARHLLPRLVRVPLLPGHLPLDQTIDLANCLFLVDQVRVYSAPEECIHVELTTTSRTMAQEVQDALQPAHKLVKKTVVVLVHFVNELVEIVLMTGAQIDKRLNGLVGVS